MYLKLPQDKTNTRAAENKIRGAEPQRGCRAEFSPHLVVTLNGQFWRHHPKKTKET